MSVKIRVPKKTEAQRLQEIKISEMFESVKEGKITPLEFDWWVRDRETTAWRDGASSGFER